MTYIRRWGARARMRACLGMRGTIQRLDTLGGPSGQPGGTTSGHPCQKRFRNVRNGGFYGCANVTARSGGDRNDVRMYIFEKVFGLKYQ